MTLRSCFCLREHQHAVIVTKNTPLLSLALGGENGLFWIPKSKILIKLCSQFP